MPVKRVLLSLDVSWFHRLGLNRFTYQRALRRAGLEPVLVDFRKLDDATDEAALAAQLLDGMHGLVLAGGGDVDPALYGESPQFSLEVNPQRDRFELALLRYAESEDIPVLAICRGHQLLNVWRGGTLKNLREDPVAHRYHRSRWRGHSVALHPDSRVARFFNTTTLGSVTSYHGQAIDTPGQGLAVVGTSPDGVIEAVESLRTSAQDGYFGMVGVQWHPEVRTGEIQMRLFRAFANAVRSPANEAAHPELTHVERHPEPAE